MDGPFSSPDRIWMCSILFLDIVNYSSQSVQLQLRWKDRFNRYLEKALADVAEAERVILDTGDGAAICFLGGPDTAMIPALKMRSFFVGEEPAQRHPMLARMGINLGPVKLVQDINGQRNALGDGINAGQRIMSFAGDNQILVSRSFYEVVSCLSDSFVPMFCFVGARRDKHDREHLVYQLAPAGEALPPAPAIAEPIVAPPGQFDAAVLEYLQSLLAPVLGPIAAYMVKEAGRKHTNLSDLCSELAIHFAVGRERARFLEQCSKQLGVGAMDAPPLVKSPSAIVFDPAMLERATKELALHIGPMARLIVDRTAGEVHTMEDFYEALGREIPSTQDRARFLARCKAGA